MSTEVNLLSMATDPIVHVPPDSRLGPAMLALSNRHRAFVVALMELGGSKYSAAAAAAGYSAGNKDALAVTATRLAHDDRILDAIQEESKRRLGAALGLATSNLVKIIEDGKPSDKLQAMRMLFDRTGLHAKSEQLINVKHTPEDEAGMIERIRSLAGDLGLDPAALLGTRAALPAPPVLPLPLKPLVADAVFVDISPTARGLEDLL